jgi:ribosomal protein S18 acetylase RimI-like enzyme
VSSARGGWTATRCAGRLAAETGLRIEACGPEQADVVHHLTQEAFRAQASLEPPSSAGRETLEAVRADLATGGAVAHLDGRPAGCLRCAAEGDHLHVRRVAVLPELQGRGIGSALMAWAEARAAELGLAEVTIGVRLALTGNLRLYRRLGYEEVALRSHPGWHRPTWVAMRKRVTPR